jgi:hypothetical protein
MTVVHKRTRGVTRGYLSRYRVRRHIRSAALLAVALVTLGATTSLTSAGRKFYSDDPLAREPETQDASKAAPWEIELFTDLMLNLFVRPNSAGPDVRAQNVNTIDEVPDSGWFTNRILARSVSAEELSRGSIEGEPPASGRWTIVRAKSSGFSPGFTMRDSRGETWFVSFDAKGHPEAATGAVMVANKLFWALGYWQVENYLATIRAEDIAIAEDVTMRVPSRKRRPMSRAFVDEVLARAHRSADGSYRTVAARLLPGKVLGSFKYFGTRSDDPNDLVPHEHRRELRALKVFGAWTNLVDMKAGNTLDVVDQVGNRSVVRHYLQDVGSTFGTGALGPREWDEGWEFLYEGDTAFKRLISLGFYIKPWQTVNYREYPSIGRFEGDVFDPMTWKPRVPTAAFLRARPDDTFWAARRVAAFSDDLIRTAVKAGQYTDATAADHLTTVLIKRRDAIARAYLPTINPLADFALSASGQLTFENVAVAAGVAPAPARGYQAVWSVFDNSTGESRALGSPVTGPATGIQAPSDAPTGSGTYVKVQVSAVDPSQRSWAIPVDVYFRRGNDGWRLVGLERLP